MFYYLTLLTWLTILSVFLSTGPADLVPSYGHLQSQVHKSFRHYITTATTCLAASDKGYKVCSFPPGLFVPVHLTG